MKKVFFKFLIFGVLFIFLGLWSFQVTAAVEKTSLSGAVYFTGVGCSHCAQTDPIVLGEYLTEYPDLVVIEYEIYQTAGNAQVLDQYETAYELPVWECGIPALFINKSPGGIIVGDSSILKNFENKISEVPNQYLLVDGSVANFSQTNLNQWPGYPKVWHQDRILIKEGDGKWIFAWNDKIVPKNDSTLKNPADVLLSLIKAGDSSLVLQSLSYDSLPNNLRVALSGGEVTFNYAVRLIVEGPVSATPLSQELTLTKVISLAAVDAINPCALAVLLLMLTAIMTGNTPKGKKKILLGGLAFIMAVFIIYFIYGLIIIRLFQVVQLLAPVKIWMYRILGGLAILLGISNIKDFFYYRPGGLGTEMPLFLRPKMKKFISKVTSPSGAFIAGALVTVFLLPCTIGPYFIASGILSVMNILKIIPWLLLYNLVFVLPMIVVVFLVHGGLGRVKDVSQWKEKNITKIHLVEGLIMLGLGMVMILGIF